MHLYIHVPFCARRCSYCDFAIAVRREVPSAAFAQAIEREWAAWQDHPSWDTSPPPRAPVRACARGATPARADPAARGGPPAGAPPRPPLAADAEVTLEAN